MKFNTHLVLWHGKLPIFSLDFHASGRFATGGGDNCVKIWKIEGERVEFLSNLFRHTQSVNTVRFSPSGEYLASAADDGLICIWEKTDVPPAPVIASGGQTTVDDDFDSMFNKEVWTTLAVLPSGGKEIYDISWSADGKYLVSGSIDAVVCLWDVESRTRVQEYREHTHYIQGCAFDPRMVFFSTMCLDRALRIYRLNKGKSVKYHVAHAIKRREDDKISVPKPAIASSGEGSATPAPHSKVTDEMGVNSSGHFMHKLFLDESVTSFFRRVSWSPDGLLLFAPAGVFIASPESKQINCTYIFARDCLSKPIGYIPSPNSPMFIAKCNPKLWKLRPNPTQTPLINTPLQYRIIVAVASSDSVMLYDTQRAAPFVFLKDIHYAGITDLSWTPDGQTLGITSSDGYCSLLHFEANELGDLLDGAELQAAMARVEESQAIVRKRHEDRAKVKEAKAAAAAAAAAANAEGKMDLDQSEDAKNPKKRKAGEMDEAGLAELEGLIDETIGPVSKAPKIAEGDSPAASSAANTVSASPKKKRIQPVFVSDSLHAQAPQLVAPSAEASANSTAPQ